MLNWVLNRNAENAAARDAAGDTTQFEAPDTPAPIFAARAIRSALFGTPQRPTASSSTVSGFLDSDDGNDNGSKTTVSRAITDAHTPTKPAPPGILLTPGTGTSKRKRVSFGRDVLSDNGSRTSLSSAGGKTGSGSPWGSGKRGARRTRLTELLEGAKRKSADKKAGKVEQQQKTLQQQQAQQQAQQHANAVEAQMDNRNNKDAENIKEEEGLQEDDDWEEEDDDAGDVTTDMNEPHSRSGKFWKSEYEQYRRDSMTELGKLIKYKKLAKSYAVKKDAEATELAEQLRQEQERVIQMEKRITESASQIVSRRLRESGRGVSNNDEADARRLSELTAEMLTYKERVQQLEPELARMMAERGDDLAEGRIGGVRARGSSDSLSLSLVSASPRTASTLLELQRELRRARAQVRENEQLRRQNKRLQSELEGVNRRMVRFEEDNKRLVGENASLAAKVSSSSLSVGVPPADTTRLLDLRTKLREAEDECRQKDEEIKLVRAEMEEIRGESKARDAAKGEVIEKLRAKLNETKAKLRAAQKGEGRERPKSWAATTDGGRLRGGGGGDEAARRLGERYSKSSGNINNNNNNNNNKGGAQVQIQQIIPSRSHPSILAEKAGFDNYNNYNSNYDNNYVGINLNRPTWQPYIPRSPRNRASTTTATMGMNKDVASGLDLLRAKFPGIGAKPVGRSRSQSQSQSQNQVQSRNGKIIKDWRDRRAIEAGEETEEEEEEEEEESENEGVDENGEDQEGEGEEVGEDLDGASRISRLDSPRRAAAIARIERRVMERRKSASGLRAVVGRLR